MGNLPKNELRVRRIIFQSQIVTNEQNIGLPQRAWVVKTIHELDSPAMKNIQAQCSVKKVTWKYQSLLISRYNSKQYFIMSNPYSKFTLFIEWPSYIYSWMSLKFSNILLMWDTIRQLWLLLLKKWRWWSTLDCKMLSSPGPSATPQICLSMF